MAWFTGKAAYSLSSYSVVLGGRQWGWGSVAGRVEPLGCGFLLLASHLVVGWSRQLFRRLLGRWPEGNRKVTSRPRLRQNDCQIWITKWCQRRRLGRLPQ